MTPNRRPNFCINTESIFVEIFLPESKSVLINVLYRPSDKCDFVNCLERTLGDTNVIETKEYYLLGDVNIMLQTRDKKICLETNAQMLLIKRYLIY